MSIVNSSLSSPAAVPAGSAGAVARTTGMAWLLCFYAVFVSIAMATYALWSAANAPLLLPLAVLTAATAAFLLTLAARQGGGAPVFQIGGFFGLMTFLYAAYPMVVYLARGMEYGPTNDGRLYAAQPTPAELGAFEWWYVAFFVTFAVVYLLVTRGHTASRLSVAAPPRGIVIVVLTAYCAASAVLWLVMRMFPFEVRTYGDMYLALRQPPTVVRQLASTIVQLMPTLLIIVVAMLFTHYRRRRFWIVVLLAWVCFSALYAMKARTTMFMILFVAAFLYHNLVRRISLTVALAGILAALSALAWLGVMRYEDPNAVSAERALLGSSEFEVILGNAYDLRHVRSDQGKLLTSPAVYMSDFVALLPQQLVPFQKQTKSGWYLATYWPEVEAAGGGLAFGLLAEAVTGFGRVEIFVRAALVGLVFGLLQRRVTSRPISFWLLVAYLWLTVWSYHILRNTTFCLLQWSVYQLLLPIIGIRVTYVILSRSKQRLRRWRVA